MVERAKSKMGKGQEELETYLAFPQFSQKITCPRTSLQISFSQIGDPEGCPVLFIPPAVCSRWFAVPLDQICRESGIKLISIDRPGCGFTPSVDIEERLDISSKHILSVMEHLKMEPRHIIAFSSGIYYSLHLLRYYHKELGGMLQPIFISPWIPPSYDEGDVMKTAMTTVPNLAFVLKPSAATDQVFVTSLEEVKTSQTSTSWAGRLKGLIKPGRGGDDDETPQTEWSKQASSVTTNRINEGNHQGIADEILISHSHGPGWFQEMFQALSNICEKEDMGMVPTIWFGTQDTIVSKKSHLWLQKMFDLMPKMGCKSYKVEGGDHMDLLWRDEGIKQVFAMIHFRERVYYGG